MTNFLENNYVLNNTPNSIGNVMRIESLLCQNISNSESMAVNFDYNPNVLLCAPNSYLEFDSSESSPESQESTCDTRLLNNTFDYDVKKSLRKRRTPKVSPEPANNNCGSNGLRFVNYAQHHWAPQPSPPPLPSSLPQDIHDEEEYEEEKTEEKKVGAICIGDDIDTVGQNGFWAEAFLRECGIVCEESTVSTGSSVIVENSYDSSYEELQSAEHFENDRKQEMVRSSAPSPEPVSFRFKQYSGAEMEKVVRMTKERALKKNKGPSPWRLVNKERRSSKNGVSKEIRKKRT